MRKALVWFMALVLGTAAFAREYHVALTGQDTAKGNSGNPLKTISAAAALAQPGDVIIVHEGVYREHINPPRGGKSDAQRIVYQAAPGEKVIIKGSELIKGWVKATGDTWRVTVPNTLFGDFNPYEDLLHGDWFDPRGREHHTGAVYLNGHWLKEAASLADVMRPFGTASRYGPDDGNYLLNVAWIRLLTETGATNQVAATSYVQQSGIQTAACSEGGDCIGWINQGDWVAYQGLRLDDSVTQLELRVASASQGGLIEVRSGSPTGKLRGTGKVENTGDWQAWQSCLVSLEGTGYEEPLYLVFRSIQTELETAGLWYAKVGPTHTTLWAQFQGIDPNSTDVEINVRRTVFYPLKTGINYLTVRGFTLLNAATPWAPPTAEQPGLIGTNWSKGWIIEDNTIAYSMCVGIALGKHGDEFDNTSQNSAEGYVETIKRAFERGWSKENIGHHLVRNNHISNCEQAGIVGSLGAVFCTIAGNEIHDVQVRRLFSGAEVAGIKFHGAIDTVISHNRIYNCCQGLWLDWMAQGTRVTGNLFYNNPERDLFMEVNHGPYVVDNNLFLSRVSLLDVSEGGAFVHNLFAGAFIRSPEPNRETPYHLAHSTEVAGLATTQGGDNRFFNNLFVAGTGLALYNAASRPNFARGNVFLTTAVASSFDEEPGVFSAIDARCNLMSDATGLALELDFAEGLPGIPTQLITSESLGVAAVTGLPYEQADGAPYTFNTDYLGKPRSKTNPTPGPFEEPGTGPVRLYIK